MDKDGSGTLSVAEAESIFLRINSRLGRAYGEDEVALFFKTLDRNGDGVINLNEFRAAFDKLI
jgi:Ca2+-binding EF-hand superfamily protein